MFRTGPVSAQKVQQGADPVGSQPPQPSDSAVATRSFADICLWPAPSRFHSYLRTQVSLHRSHRKINRRRRLTRYFENRSRPANIGSLFTRLRSKEIGCGLESQFSITGINK